MLARPMTDQRVATRLLPSPMTTPTVAAMPASASRRKAVAEIVLRARPSAADVAEDEVRAHYVRLGRATVLIDGRRVDLGHHALLWLLPAQDLIWVDRSPDFRQATVAWRRPAVLAAIALGADSILAQPSASVSCRELATASTSAIEALLDDLAGQDDAQVFEAGLHYALFRLWHAWCGGREAPISEVHAAVVTVARLLRHTTAALDASALGRSVGLSADHLGRLFADQLGVSLVDYRNRQCLDRLLASLEAGERSLERAAREAGFGSYAQFHRVFTRAMGMSPRAHVAGL